MARVSKQVQESAARVREERVILTELKKINENLEKLILLLTERPNNEAIVIPNRLEIGAAEKL